jgi:hypothetical protein
VGSDGRVLVDGEPRKLGVGLLQRTIDIPQEVSFVTEAICSD